MPGDPAVGMTDILDLMAPGEVYSFEDICEALENRGYRVTSTDTVKDSLYKLSRRGDILIVSSFYIKVVQGRGQDEIEDIAIVQEILSVTVPGQTYDARAIKGLRSSQGLMPFPRAVLSIYLEMMAGYGMMEKVDDEEYLRLRCRDGRPFRIQTSLNILNMRMTMITHTSAAKMFS